LRFLTLKMSVDPSKKYLSFSECMEIVPGRTENGIRGLVKRRAIPFRKVGGRLVFIRSEIERWIDGSPGVSLEDLQKK